MKNIKKSSFVFTILTCLAPALALAGDGIVALQTADPGCGDDSGNFFVDCGNGTVTDNRTGLIWLKDADCLLGAVDYLTAREFARDLADESPTYADCELADNSSPGEWRLPSASEWQVMITDTPPDCEVVIPNDAGNGCWTEACHDFGICSFKKIRTGQGPQGNFSYWSSTPGHLVADHQLRRVTFNLESGGYGYTLKSGAMFVWPVRGGQ